MPPHPPSFARLRAAITSFSGLAAMKGVREQAADLGFDLEGEEAATALNARGTMRAT